MSSALKEATKDSRRTSERSLMGRRRKNGSEKSRSGGRVREEGDKKEMPVQRAKKGAWDPNFCTRLMAYDHLKQSTHTRESKEKTRSLAMGYVKSEAGRRERMKSDEATLSIALQPFDTPAAH